MTVVVPDIAVTLLESGPTVSMSSVVDDICVVARYVIPPEANRLIVGSSPTAEVKVMGSVAPI